MKRFLLVFVAAPLFFSCTKSSSPKETAQAFVKALYTADLATAAGYVSNESKAVLDRAKTQAHPTATPEETFRFATLTETVSGQRASVKNEVLSIPLVKEEEGWKVTLTEDLLNTVQNREDMLTSLKAKWGSLQKEYEARVVIAKDYIRYKKSLGALSPQATALNSMLDNTAPPTEWTRETLLAYVQKQQLLNTAIEGALEPSQAANTDLTVSYFLQLNNARDRIKAAESEYQPLAEKAYSSLYVPLPIKAGSSLQVKTD